MIGAMVGEAIDPNIVFGPVDTLSTKTNEILEKAITAINKSEPGSLSLELERFANAIEAIVKKLDLRENEDLKRVYFFGIIRAVTEIIKQNTLFLNEQIANVKTLECSANIKPVIEYLFANKMACSGELSRHLKISKSHFSNFTKLLENSDIFRIEKSGRMKYFSLTSKGISIGQTLYSGFTNRSLDIDNILSICNLIQKEISASDPSANSILGQWESSTYLSTAQLKKIKLVLDDLLNSSEEKKSKRYIDNRIVSQWNDIWIALRAGVMLTPNTIHKTRQGHLRFKTRSWEYISEPEKLYRKSYRMPLEASLELENGFGQGVSENDFYSRITEGIG